MAEIRYSLLHRLVQSIAASPPGAWFFARTLHHFDRPFLALTGGRATLSGLLAGVPIVTVTTRGARSGLPRTTPLICIHDRERPEAFALIATNWGQAHYPAWYFNLKANPEADCRLQGRAGRYRAHEAAGEEYDRFWQYATEVYRGYPLYKQRISGRRIPILIMTPIQA